MCDRAAMHLLRQAVASLETISIREGFLGIASDLFRIGHLTMHERIARVPESCDSSLSMGEPITGPMLTGLVCACALA
jgi:hypothetical protein